MRVSELLIKISSHNTSESEEAERERGIMIPEELGKPFPSSSRSPKRGIRGQLQLPAAYKLGIRSDHEPRIHTHTFPTELIAYVYILSARSSYPDPGIWGQKG